MARYHTRLFAVACAAQVVLVKGEFQTRTRHGVSQVASTAAGLPSSTFETVEIDKSLDSAATKPDGHISGLLEDAAVGNPQDVPQEMDGAPSSRLECRGLGEEGEDARRCAAWDYFFQENPEYYWDEDEYQILKKEDSPKYQPAAQAPAPYGRPVPAHGRVPSEEEDGDDFVVFIPKDKSQADAQMMPVGEYNEYLAKHPHQRPQPQGSGQWKQQTSPYLEQPQGQLQQSAPQSQPYWSNSPQGQHDTGNPSSPKVQGKQPISPQSQPPLNAPKSQSLPGLYKHQPRSRYKLPMTPEDFLKAYGQDIRQYGPVQPRPDTEWEAEEDVSEAEQDLTEPMVVYEETMDEQGAHGPESTKSTQALEHTPFVNECIEIEEDPSAQSDADEDKDEDEDDDGSKDTALPEAPKGVPFEPRANKFQASAQNFTNSQPTPPGNTLDGSNQGNTDGNHQTPPNFHIEPPKVRPELPHQTSPKPAEASHKPQPSPQGLRFPIPGFQNPYDAFRAHSSGQPLVDDEKLAKMKAVSDEQKAAKAANKTQAEQDQQPNLPQKHTTAAGKQKLAEMKVIANEQKAAKKAEAAKKLQAERQKKKLEQQPRGPQKHMLAADNGRRDLSYEDERVFAGRQTRPLLYEPAPDQYPYPFPIPHPDYAANKLSGNEEPDAHQEQPEADTTLQPDAPLRVNRPRRKLQPQWKHQQKPQQRPQQNFKQKPQHHPQQRPQWQPKTVQMPQLPKIQPQQMPKPQQRPQQHHQQKPRPQRPQQHYPQSQQEPEQPVSNDEDGYYAHEPDQVSEDYFSHDYAPSHIEGSQYNYPQEHQNYVSEDHECSDQAYPPGWPPSLEEEEEEPGQQDMYHGKRTLDSGTTKKRDIVPASAQTLRTAKRCFLGTLDRWFRALFWKKSRKDSSEAKSEEHMINGIEANVEELDEDEESDETNTMVVVTQADDGHVKDNDDPEQVSDANQGAGEAPEADVTLVVIEANSGVTKACNISEEPELRDIAETAVVIDTGE